MYKILVLNEQIQDIQLNNKVKYLKPEELTKELKNSEYDLIYLKDEININSIKKIILSDYMQLPNGLKKLAIKNEVEHTYINLQIVNKLIFDNIDIIEFKNFYEKISIALILKEFLIEDIEYNKIINKICTKELKEKDINKTVDNIIKRDYADKNIIRKYKYYFNNKRIRSKFFENILVNIKHDISNMEKL